MWRRIFTPTHLDWNVREVSTDVLSIWKTDSTIRSVLITSTALLNQDSTIVKCYASVHQCTSTFSLIIWLTFKESSLTEDSVQRPKVDLLSALFSKYTTFTNTKKTSLYYIYYIHRIGFVVFNSMVSMSG